MNDYIVYVDGSCRNNGDKNNKNVGGWAFLLINKKNNLIESKSGGSINTTNNRMEMTSVIQALKYLNRKPFKSIKIVSDSNNIVRCFKENWIRGWKRRGWVNYRQEPILNKDLWEEMDFLVKKMKPKFEHIKSNEKNEYRQKVDIMAKEFSKELFFEKNKKSTC